MQLIIGNFGFNAGGWRVDRHPRLLTDVTGDGRLDVVGFGNAGVYVSRNLGNLTFAPPQLVVGNFGYSAGGWRVEQHPRFLADVTGDGLADIVGFGNAGVYVSRNLGNLTFAPPQLVVGNFGYSAGGWRVEQHPRFLADVTGDGLADIVGFGNAGVYVSRNLGNLTFAPPQLVVGNFGYSAGGWRVEQHPRFLADVTGDGLADIVGFGNAGVYVSRNLGNLTFAPPQLVVGNFGYSAGGWRVEQHPRFLADVTGDGLADIVGFGNAGVYVSRNLGNLTFAPPQLVVGNFGYSAGGWRVEQHPRFLADVTGDGLADIVGFGNAGVYVSRNGGNLAFGPPELVIRNFGYSAGGWRVEQHPRFLADVTGDGLADIVGFGNAGAWVAPNGGNANFGLGLVRRDIWDLEAGGPWDPVTLAYARAIRALQARPSTDPRSWTYQSAVHGTTAPTPPGAVWNQCQHGSWFFLSWHRMYLHYFERIVRAEVVAAGGPSDWALPFWDYAGPGKAALPPAFRAPTMPDGTPNPLFVGARNAAVNAGALLPSSVTNSTAAMAATVFTPAAPATGFGGGATSPQHFFGATGALESTPHNVVHVSIGGWMSDPDRAASDPIFWLHHCNIDRLWEVWLRQGGGRANPTAGAWLTTPFTFHDENGTQVTLRGQDIVDTALQLGYTYQGIAADVPAGEEADVQPEPEFTPEMVGASSERAVLAGAEVSVEVVIDPRSVQDFVAASAVAAPRRVYLGVEDVEAMRAPEVAYEVFVSVPGTDAAVPQYVGSIGFFGIEHLSRGEEDGPHGFRQVFDVTAQVGRLREDGAFDGSRLSVSFRPITLVIPPSAADAMTEDDAGVAAEAAARPVRIGRVSVFYA